MSSKCCIMHKIRATVGFDFSIMGFYFGIYSITKLHLYLVKYKWFFL